MTCLACGSLLHAGRLVCVECLDKTLRERSEGDARIAALEAENARLTEAAIAVRQLVMDAQDILATYILPDSNIDDYDCCNRLLELTDGPRQRAVFEQLRAALAEPPK